MSRRIIPVLCALAVAVVPATALAQPAQDPSPAVTRGGVVYGDTKYDLQNQQDQPTGTHGVRAGDLGRHEGRPAPRDRPAPDQRTVTASTASRPRQPPRTHDRVVARRRRPTTTRPTAGRSRPSPRPPSSRPSRSVRPPWWRAASTALPTWGCRGARRRGGGAVRGPAPLGASPPCPQSPLPIPRSFAPCSLAASWPAPARCASPSPPPPPPRTCGTSATFTTPSRPWRSSRRRHQERPARHGHRPSLPGDTKADLPGAIAPTPASHNTAVAPRATAQRAGAVATTARTAGGSRP